MSQLRRNGPLALLAVTAVGVGGVVILGGNRQDGGGGGATTSDATATDVLFPEGGGAPEPVGRMPVTYAEADAAGTTAALDWGERCDPATGRVKVPSVYAAPCVPVFDGDNGGATGPGVTADTVRVVRYVPESSGDLAALVAGAPDETPDQQAETFRAFVELYSSRAELYGRRVELVDFRGSGAGDDVVAAKADATEIATGLEPFLVVGGPQLDRGTFAQELASHGVVCVDCAGALTGPMLAEMAPYVWGLLPSGEQFFQALTAWAGALDPGPGPGGSDGGAEDGGDDLAEFAGEGLRDRPRRIGAVHFDQDPPVFAVPDDRLPAGVEIVESYVLDPDTLPVKATELVAKLKAEGVTTVVFLGDPLMPAHLTRAATEQGWYPEWVFTGTAFTDTNLFARQYDPAQMAHAFGISQLAAPVVQDLQEPVRLYRWYFGGDDALPPARGTYGALQATARFVVHGVHMAGPDLTPDTFARGLFRIPPAGGGPTTPQVSYGDWGFFPSTDHSGVDDAAELWWDPTVRAPDETGTAGEGAWRRAHGGRRFTGAGGDAPPPAPFDPAGTVTVLDELPAADVPPDYPPPPGAPAGD